VNYENRVDEALRDSTHGLQFTIYVVARPAALRYRHSPSNLNTVGAYVEPYKVSVKYIRNSSPEKTLDFECSERALAFIVDSEVLERVMKSEEPDVASILPLLKDVPRGQPGQRMPSNIELMKRHGISSLSYEIDGCIFRITT
jgi:hypothetical protein